MPQLGLKHKGHQFSILSLPDDEWCPLSPGQGRRDVWLQVTPAAWCWLGSTGGPHWSDDPAPCPARHRRSWWEYRVRGRSLGLLWWRRGPQAPRPTPALGPGKFAVRISLTRQPSTTPTCFNMGTTKLPLMEGLTTTGRLSGLRLDMTEPRYSPLFSPPSPPPVLP